VRCPRIGRLVDRNHLDSEAAEARGRRALAIGEEDRRPAQPPTTKIQRLKNGLRVSYPHIDERHLKTPLGAHPGSGGSGELPVVADAELVQGRLQYGPHLLAPHHEHPRPAGFDRRGENVSQLVGIDRLGHDPLAGQLSTSGKNGHENDWRAAHLGVFPDLRQHIEPAHLRHEHVQRDHVVRRCPQHLQRLGAPGGDVGLDAQRSQLPGDQLGDLPLIIHDQHPAAANCLQRGQRLGCWDRSGQKDAEGGSHTGLALDRDLPSMELDQRLDDRQAEPRSGRARRPLRRPVEALEHPAGLLFGHPHAVILNGDLDPGPLGLDAHVDAPSLARVYMRVGDQVGHDLTQARGIRQDQTGRRSDIHTQPLPLLLDPRAHQLGHLARRLAGIHRPAVDLDMVGFDPGHVQEVGDQLGQPVGRLEDDLHELTLALGHVLR
jgi:hypothetical protein